MVIVDQTIEKENGLLLRWKCPGCDMTVTEYPDFALPYKRYTLPTILAFSQAYVEEPRYEDPSDSGSYGKPEFLINPDGSWERYTYTDDGYLSTTTVPLLDAPFDAPDTEVKTIENDYTLHTDDSDPARFRAYPRTVTTRQAGIVTSKTYHVFREDRAGCVTDTREDCADPAALPGDGTNLITTTYYPIDETQASSGNIKSTCFKDGKADLYTYDYGDYTQTNGIDQPGTFTQGTGSEIRTTVIHTTASSLDGIPGKTTMEILIDDEFGRLLLEELYVRTDTGYERISWKVHTRDDLGRPTATIYSDGTREEKTWGCCVLESETDRFGQVMSFTYDALKRVLTEAKETGQGDLVTSFTYDGSGNELTQTVTAGTLALSSSVTYDLAGRIKSVTGTGSAGKYYDYGVNADGTHWTMVFSGSPDSPMWETTTVNLLDQAVTIEKPGYNGRETITNNYNTSGQRVKTTAPGMADTLVEYNELGEQTKTGLDINQNGILDDTETYYCKADAQAAAEKLSKIPKKSDCFLIDTAITEVVKYRRGRPKNGEKRLRERIEYQLEINLIEDESKVELLREEAGCFVLLSNLDSPSERNAWSAEEFLRLYKDQGGIERNFGFLKDPVIVNSVFLKKNSRIEVLGMVLIIALLIWRLIERSMRLSIEQEQTTITGWVRRRTKRPTSFMMSTKFHTILVIKSGEKRQLACPLKSVHLEYLNALDVDPKIFVTP